MPRQYPHLFIGVLVVLLMATLLPLSSAHAQLRKVYKDETEPDNEIEKISFYSPAAGYVAFRDWIGFTTDSGRTFIKKPVTLTNVNYNGYGVNLTFGFGINGVKAFDQNTLIAYGDYGLVPAILRSTDGGNTFLLVYHSQFDNLKLSTGIMDMVFANNGNTGIAVDADRILRTTDKGLTWNVVYTNANRYFSHVDAIDNNTFFAFSTRYTTSVYYRSMDAGASWTPYMAPGGHLTSITFLTATKGWANADDKIFYTSNNGSQWTQKNHATITPMSSHKMKFMNDHTGYALGELFELYKTTDSGRIWEKVPRDNDFTYLGYSLNDLQVWNDDQLWTGGGHGFLQLNTNSSAAPLPGAYFQIDTAGMSVANVVQLKNYSKTGYQYQWIVNGVAVSTSFHASYVHDIYLGADTVQLIVSNGAHSDTTEKLHYFDAVPYPAPLVTGFTPSSGNAGTEVTITGNFFAKVSGVYFGGIPASSYTVQSIGKIVAVVGAGGNGLVTVTSATGSGSKPGFITNQPPVITGLSPVLAPVGATVTVNGNHFGATPVENTVFFGGVKAKVLTAGPGQLTVQVPAGAAYGPVSVTVKGHTAHSPQFFSITFPATCGFTEYTFAPSQAFPGSNLSLGATMSIGDIDGDGKNDIATPSFYGTFVLHNKSTAGKIDFQKVLAYETDQAAVAGAGLADLDGDGKPDLVALNYHWNTLAVYRNTSSIGAISFAMPDVQTVTGGPTGVVFHDLDGDGKQDMIIINEAANFNYLSVYRNISLPGQIAFEPKQEIPVGLSDNKVSIGDLDGDGKADLFVGDGGILNGNQYSFTILRNTSIMGSISFARTLIPHHAFTYMDGQLGDMDGDGKLDIVVTYDTRYYTGTQKGIAIHRNLSTPGNLSFAMPVSFTGCIDHTNVSLGDLDGDGMLDLFSTCSFNTNVTLLKNTSTPGNLSLVAVNSPYISMRGGGGTTAIADLDNDSRPDLLFAGSNDFRVFRNILEPGALAGKDTTICQGQSVTLGQLDAVDHQYAWTSSPTGFTSTAARPVVSPAVSTDYYVSVTNPSGCISKDTIRITVGGTGPLAQAGADATVCMGSSKQLGMTAVAPNSYSWTSVPAGFTSALANPVVTPSGYQTSYILAVNTGNCIARDTVTLYTTALPVADAGPDRNVCLPGGTNIGTAATGSNTYSWTSSPVGYSSIQAFPIVYPTLSTTYYLEVTSQAGCKTYDTVQTRVDQSLPVPTVTAGGATTFCQGSSVVLTASTTQGNQWYKNGVAINAATATNYTAAEAGTYTVQNTLAGSSCSPVMSAGVPVVVNAVPAAPVITQTGNSLISSAAAGNQWYLNGVAIPGAVNNSYRPVTAGLYTVIVTQAGCNSQTAATFNYTITAINEPTWGNSLVVAPNPVHSDVAIRYTGNSSRFTASITDLHGRQLKIQPLFRTSCVFDLRSLSAGMYIVRIGNIGTGEFVNRVIVKQ
ncbi:FG-GAP-like repeat-containing protein [Paraflavitalea sp. CAU 1676]|uniref:FG-GAP-like repeat-containing protein n=1 Tax=Paraflavitalea sp. CAU 1676 TaxID=3032598 RepID=UPI0023DC73B6|nr:FG-GAP-like repeat-containing protein [Paraflavitalea sp. CAU 1676]MDF2188484.1 FG-GAP-like repeat-containing protein [Paraflavitalea sp. CAU 1676]